VVGAFLGLSRSRSDARRYPAIDPLISWSKYVDGVAKELSQQVEGWDEKVKKARRFLYEGNEIGKRMEVVGEEGTALNDMIVYLKGELYDFSYLQQNAFDKEDAYCPLKRQIPLFQLITSIFDAQFKFQSHDEAREFFLNLQNQIKNMNFMSFQSQQYRQTFAAVEEIIKQRQQST